MAAWSEFFPFTSVRPIQVSALDFLIENIESEINDIFIDAPTGSGKSAIVIALARWLAAQGQSSYITTITIALEGQYMADFSRLGLRQLHAKSHYACTQFGSCDLGSLFIKTSNGKKRRCNDTACSYQCAKAQFLAAEVGIANNAFAVTCARQAADWAPREAAFFDEAHLLHDAICSQYSIEISSREVEYFPAEGAEIPWLRDVYRHWLKTEIRELEEEINQIAEIDPRYPELGRMVNRWERAKQKLQNLEKLLGDDLDKWVIDQQEDKLTISPVWATDVAGPLLSCIGGKRIYLSATLPGFEQECRYLGIDPAKAAYLSVDCPFPVEHRLIHVCPRVRWDYKNPIPSIGQACRAIDDILKLHLNERGLVHTSSYYQARQIIEGCRNKRLVTHADAREKDLQLVQMYQRPGTVLVSPSSHEGLDLYDDRSRFQIIAKLPYADLKDKRVKRRMEQDKSWYGLNTAMKLVQACGRSIRSDTDYAVTYIIDAGFDAFVERNGRFLPRYFWDALRIKEVPI